MAIGVIDNLSFGFRFFSSSITGPKKVQTFHEYGLHVCMCVYIYIYTHIYIYIAKKFKDLPSAI